MEPVVVGIVEQIVDQHYLNGLTSFKAVIVRGKSFPIEIFSEVAGNRIGQDLRDPVAGDIVSVFTLGIDTRDELIGVIGEYRKE